MEYYSPNNICSLPELIRLKKQKSLSVGVCLPVLNEAETLAKTIRVLKSCGELIDTIIVIDSGSTDGSREICRNEGVKFIPDTKTSIEFGIPLAKGKGWNLWSSLYHLDTDIIVWLDSDIQNINRNFPISLIGPMLLNDKIQFVKGYWYRKNSFARVTEICVRPFINTVFPELKDFIQPLSGEYGGRREFLRNLYFLSGFSVEFAVLLQARNKLIDDEIAQSFVGKRFHQHSDARQLGKMSASILQTMLKLAKETGKIYYNETDLHNDYLSFYLPNGRDIIRDEYFIDEKLLPPMTNILHAEQQACANVHAINEVQR